MCPQLARAQAAIAATITGRVADATDAAVANADVVLTGPRHYETHTDGQGRFVLVNVLDGTYRVDVSAPTLGHASRDEIVVSGDTTVAVTYESALATGGPALIGHVSTSAARINVTPSAVTTLTPADFAEQGQTTWENVLNTIPGVTVGGTNKYYPVGSPIGGQIIALGGALPYESSVLIDGMPIVTNTPDSAPGAGVDLSQYDPNAFGSYDVVQGPGAQSPTIVNAIGGSLNLHPNDLVQKNHLNATAAYDAYGGVVATIAGGARIKHLSISASYGVNDSPGAFNASVMNFANTPATVDGHVYGCTAPAGYCGTNGDLTGAATSIVTCCVNYQTSWTQHSGSVSLRYDLSPNVSAHVFYAGLQTLGHAPNAAFLVDFQPPAGYTGAVPAGTSLMYANFAPQSNEYTSASSALEERITANIGPGTFHIAALQNRVFGSFAWVSSGDPMTQNLYGGGTLDGVPAVFNGEPHTVTYDPFGEFCRFRSDNRDEEVGYDASFGHAHAGVSLVQSSYNTPDECSGTAPGDYPSAEDYQVTDEWRSYVGGEPAKNVTTDLSYYVAQVRYHVQNPDDPSGSTYVDKTSTYSGPRFGAVWHPTPNIAVRAGAGGGFAEQQLDDLVGSNGVPQADNPSSPSYYLTSLENVNLRPETSFGYSLGADARLPGDAMASLDFYRTNLWGQFYTSLTPNGTFGGLPLYLSQTLNLAQSRYEGVLLTVKRDVPHGLIWTLSGGLTRGYVVSVPPGFYDGPDGPYTQNLSVVPNINFNDFNGLSIPYSQGYARIGYRWASHAYAFVDATYYGSNNQYYQPAFAIVNLNGEVPLTHNLSLHASFQNMAGTYDASIMTVGPDTVVGLPTVAGPPATGLGAIRAPYGPRAFLLTARLAL